LSCGSGGSTQSIGAPAERVGLVSGHIRRLIKKTFYIFSLGKESRKFYCEFNVELHGTDDDREPSSARC